ncbi:hypothetical protein [Micavibrio aeruginosavorus]|uniref:hypothetical protein n=1 Tax=Micavibrio aeruginosavorus TaxID=349221 RepID=UPI003F4ADB93
MPLLETLIEPQNVAGLWAVIGATSAASITLLGIFFNNLYENARRRKEREHTLVREAYFGGVEYLTYCQNKIQSILRNGSLIAEDHDREYSEKFYKLFMIASPKVIDIYSKLSIQYNDQLFSLGKEALLLQECIGQVALHKQGIDMALEAMKIANQNMDEYNDKNKNVPELWELHTEQYNNAVLDFEKNSEQRDAAHKKELLLRIKLLESGMKAFAESSQPTHAALSCMREELDRSLSRREFKRIQNNINLMQERMTQAYNAFIQELEAKIATMEQAA